MAVGDRVRVGMGTIDIATTNVPVYDVANDEQGNIVFGSDGSVSPRQIGGVKGGSYGKIVGPSVRVIKSQLRGYGEGAAALAVDYVQMYPVEFEFYKKVAWVPQDHVHIC